MSPLCKVDSLLESINDHIITFILLFVFFGKASLYFFPEFLFHRQCLFGCKVTKFPTKAFIEIQKMFS